MEYYYKYKGITYQIVIDPLKEGIERVEQIYKDFKYLEDIKDFGTIDNRVVNGIKWKWLIPVENEK